MQKSITFRFKKVPIPLEKSLASTKIRPESYEISASWRRLPCESV